MRCLHRQLPLRVACLRVPLDRLPSGVHVQLLRGRLHTDLEADAIREAVVKRRSMELRESYDRRLVSERGKTDAHYRGSLRTTGAPRPQRQRCQLRPQEEAEEGKERKKHLTPYDRVTAETKHPVRVHDRRMRSLTCERGNLWRQAPRSTG